MESSPETWSTPRPSCRRPAARFSEPPTPCSLPGVCPPCSRLGPCLLLESGGSCLHLPRRQQGDMTSHSGPSPARHGCWPGIKAAVPFLTFVGPHLTPSMCSRHFIVCQGDKQNPPPESREGGPRGALTGQTQISVVPAWGPLSAAGFFLRSHDSTTREMDGFVFMQNQPADGTPTPNTPTQTEKQPP